MLLGILLALVLVGVLKAFEQPYISEIEKHAGNVFVTIPARKKLHKLRYSLFGAYVIICCALFVGVPALKGSDPNENSRNMQRLNGILFGTFIILTRNKKFSHYGKVSLNTIDDVRKCKTDYILYLRAFEDDDYSNSKRSKGKFSENKFMSCFPKSVQVFTVGMTTEIICPRGAKRVYLNDFSWKNDVKEMIDGAKAVVVYVSDRESCIWEMSVLRCYSDKSFFITDDIIKYSNVQKELKLPNLPVQQIEPNNAILISKKGLHNKFAQFQLRKSHYKQIAEFIQESCCPR